MKTEFTSRGIVLGNYWGGGTGGYAARVLKGTTKEEIIQQATDGLDGSLDSGMGYESLIGAVLVITKKTTIEQDGKEFENKESEMVFVGDLTDEQKDFLEYCLNVF